eukprot:4182793-Amphidinium_carterae.1
MGTQWIISKRILLCEKFAKHRPHCGLQSFWKVPLGGHQPFRKVAKLTPSEPIRCLHARLRSGRHGSRHGGFMLSLLLGAGEELLN